MHQSLIIQVKQWWKRLQEATAHFFMQHHQKGPRQAKPCGPLQQGLGNTGNNFQCILQHNAKKGNKTRMNFWIKISQTGFKIKPLCRRRRSTPLYPLKCAAPIATKVVFCAISWAIRSAINTFRSYNNFLRILPNPRLALLYNKSSLPSL